MKQASIPSNEKERLESLVSYHIMDTVSEKEFDNITAIASEICQTPISLISLIDENRQWFKSHHGIAAQETPREYAFCAHAILNPQEAFQVFDAQKDDRFFDNPLVKEAPHVIFYTGIPLINQEGQALGSLCVIDHKPNKLNESQLNSLRALSHQVVQLLELRKANQKLLALQSELEHKNEALEQFASVVSHDLKSPLNNIIGFSHELQNDYAENLDEYGKDCIKYITESADHLKKFIDNILAYYKGDAIVLHEKEEIDLVEFIHATIHYLCVEKGVEFEYPKNSRKIQVNKTALEQLLINLITNGIKYNDNLKPLIKIDFQEDETFYYFSVKDNGRGISSKNREKIFELFNNLGQPDREGNMSTGIGLTTVKKLVEKLGGTIEVASKPGEGTTFSFNLRK